MDPNQDLASSMVDFYIKNKISPVRQNIKDLELHFEKREALYRQLGILPAFIKGHTVLEVGPGSGFNSLYTASLSPSRYCLVEGNPFGISDINELFTKYRCFKNNIDIVPLSLEEYITEEKFDFVFCEGVLGALGADAKKLFLYLTNFVAPGGVLIITCTDSIAYFSETIRRLFAQLIVEPDDSLSIKVQKLLPVFKSHLSRLRGMNKLYADWIIDNIVNPASIGTLFTFNDAIESIPDDFEIFSSSPNFLTDWRWYKNIFGLNRKYNERALDHYWRNAHNLLDHNHVFPSRTPEENKKLHRLCFDTRDLIKQYELLHKDKILDQIKVYLMLIVEAVADFSVSTSDALCEAYNFLSNHPFDSMSFTNSEKFGSLFGRGQQYLSFSRREKK